MRGTTRDVNSDRLQLALKLCRVLRRLDVFLLSRDINVFSKILPRFTISLRSEVHWEGSYATIFLYSQESLVSFVESHWQIVNLKVHEVHYALLRN